MTHDTGAVYQPADLSEYTFAQRLQIRLASAAFYCMITLIGSTVRFEYRGMEEFDALEKAGKHPIMTFWHDRIMLATYAFRNRGIVVITSRSFDGEYIARFIQRFGYGAIRGSSSRGGARALIQAVREMRSGKTLGFTVDGPRGPRYAAKPGPVALAHKTGNPMLPFMVESRHYGTVGSWDRLQIPRPFSKALVTVGRPIYVPADADDVVLESKLKELQAALDALVAEGRAWATSSAESTEAANIT